jgi:hypothetical protein
MMALWRRRMLAHSWDKSAALGKTHARPMMAMGGCSADGRAGDAVEEG